MSAVVRTCWLVSLLAFFVGCTSSTDAPATKVQPKSTQSDNATSEAKLSPPIEVEAKTSEAPRTPASQTETTDAAPRTSSNKAANESEASQQDQPTEKELFAGWPKPQAALVISGNQHGYIEPCGCTGLANQKGGLARRHSLLQQLAAKGWELVPVDAGNQVRRFGRQAEIQFQLTAEALKKMDYKAVGIGHEDLQLSAGEVVAAVASDNGAGPFVSANVAVLDRSLMPQAVVVEVGGRKIGITSILGDEERKKVTSGEVVMEEIDAGLKAALAQLDEAQCDYRVLLAFASVDDTKAIAKKYKVFDLVVSSGGPSEPTYELEEIEGTKSLLAQTGIKGMYVCVVGLYDDPEKPFRYERVPLDARFPDSKEMRELMAGYQNQLQELGLEGLGVKPLPHPSGRTFVGTQVCGECHTQALAVWEKTPHAHATDSLIHPGERGDIPRHFDPECLSCHVTGWEPQKYFPFTSGYLSVDETPGMMHNGCENCHGPGSAHVAAENNEGGKFTATMIEKLRGEMRLPLANSVAERKCMECHDIDNSPDFHVKGAFEKYWKEVEHKGKD